MPTVVKSQPNFVDVDTEKAMTSSVEFLEFLPEYSHTDHDILRISFESSDNTCRSAAMVKLPGWLTASSWWSASGDRQKTFSSQSARRHNSALDGVNFPVISARRVPLSITKSPMVAFNDTRRSGQGTGKSNSEFMASIPGS
ncbi:hypothetical protein CFIO01_03259 [Colletotrichum fioriniae PJ7]|uniref:Uncharacterized protein n=1 Tax=Colletotrichum fioriniae PJ7 TaxID=1445577 RepID=A0A010SJY8_9PEZI|nr:hypothetical protein CFIO01_03259 [Colletotrichum fioriniae PJ7]